MILIVLQASSGGNVNGVQLNEASVNTYVEARFQVKFDIFLFYCSLCINCVGT